MVQQIDGKHQFAFNHNFGAEASNRDLYQTMVSDIVESGMQGINGTCFAYGQTASGKTHTVKGSATDMGLLPLAIHHVFELINACPEREFLLRVSYMEGALFSSFSSPCMAFSRSVYRACVRCFSDSVQ